MWSGSPAVRLVQNVVGESFRTVFCPEKWQFISKSGKYEESHIGSDLPKISSSAQLRLHFHLGNATMLWRHRNRNSWNAETVLWHALVWICLDFGMFRKCFDVLLAPVRFGQCIVFKQLNLRFLGIQVKELVGLETEGGSCVSSQGNMFAWGCTLLLHFGSLQFFAAGAQKKSHENVRHASAPIAPWFLRDPIEGSVIAIS